MVAYDEMLKKVATQTKTDEQALSAKADSVLLQEGVVVKGRMYHFLGMHL